MVRCPYCLPVRPRAFLVRSLLPLGLTQGGCPSTPCAQGWSSNEGGRRGQEGQGDIGATFVTKSSLQCAPALPLPLQPALPLSSGCTGARPAYHSGCVRRAHEATQSEGPAVPSGAGHTQAFRHLSVSGAPPLSPPSDWDEGEDGCRERCCDHCPSRPGVTTHHTVLPPWGDAGLRRWTTFNPCNFTRTCKSHN